MMEFSSSIEDLIPHEEDVYTNPTSGRATGLSLPNEKPKQKKPKYPFNLNDEQYNAVIAGVVSAIVYSTAVQTKLSGFVPNFSGMNGSIASAILIAIIFFFACKQLKKM